MKQNPDPKEKNNNNKNQIINKNKTCHRDRIARLTASCPSHKNFNVKLFANADANANANADAWGSTIALPGLRSGKLKTPGREKKSIAHRRRNRGGGGGGVGEAPSII